MKRVRELQLTASDLDDMGRFEGGTVFAFRQKVDGNMVTLATVAISKDNRFNLTSSNQRALPDAEINVLFFPDELKNAFSSVGYKELSDHTFFERDLLI